MIGIKKENVLIGSQKLKAAKRSQGYPKCMCVHFGWLVCGKMGLLVDSLQRVSFFISFSTCTDFYADSYPSFAIRPYKDLLRTTKSQFTYISLCVTFKF